jgi:thymidylate synthase ThyX
MKVSILKKPREEEWLMVKKAAFRTIGKDTEKLPSIEWKRRMLKAQHSPIRMLEYTFLLEGIPSWVSVHLVRHVHATPFVTTQRNDRMNREEGYDRRKAPQDTPVDMIWFVNAEELITIAHKRLCMLASPETIKVVQDICKAVLRECPEWQETGLLVPLCTYRNGLCDEFKPCDYYMEHGHGYANSGADYSFKDVVNWIKGHDDLTDEQYKELRLAVMNQRCCGDADASGYFVNTDGSIDCNGPIKER